MTLHGVFLPQEVQIASKSIKKAILSNSFNLDKGENMRYVSASDAKQRFAAVLDAAQREPVTIPRQNREMAVVISPADYQRLKSAKPEEFQRFCDRISATASKKGLTEKQLEKL